MTLLVATFPERRFFFGCILLDVVDHFWVDLPYRTLRDVTFGFVPFNAGVFFRVFLPYRTRRVF